MISIVLCAPGSVPKSLKNQLKLLNICYTGLTYSLITKERSIEFLIYFVTEH